MASKVLLQLGTRSLELERLYIQVKTLSVSQNFKMEFKTSCKDEEPDGKRAQ